jgi:hypothetical protein
MHDVGLDVHLYRFDGTTVANVGEISSDSIHGNGASALFSDGDNMIAFYDNGSSNRRAYRLSNFETGSSHTAVLITSPVLNPIPLTDPQGFYPFVASDPSPLVSDRRVFFWSNPGNKNAATLNLYRFNYRRITFTPSAGSYTLNEIVTQSVSGATGQIVAIDPGVSMDLTNVTGTFDATNLLTGADSGATSTATSLLLEQAATSLGVGVDTSDYGLPMETNGGLNRIPTIGTARPDWHNAQAAAIPGGRRYQFVVWGTGTTEDLKLYYSLGEGAPDTEATILATGRISGASPIPTLSANTIQGVTPDDGATVYFVDLDTVTDNIASGTRITLLLDVV